MVRWSQVSLAAGYLVELRPVSGGVPGGATVTLSLIIGWTIGYPNDELLDQNAGNISDAGDQYINIIQRVVKKPL